MSISPEFTADAAIITVGGKTEAGTGMGII